MQRSQSGGDRGGAPIPIANGLMSRWLDNTLGPPVLSAYQARIYRVPDEKQGAAMLEAQVGTSGPTRSVQGVDVAEGSVSGSDDAQ